ncbi:LysR family transcriptional regulator [uncultured Ruegeria sp.]|nr:LysR family transcriptional regulator [uncultured Ruegeria sp.]
MKLLATVVDKGSFAHAAKDVGLTPAMVGRRIAAMESELGFVLLNRSTRSMQLTPGGKEFYDGCLRILADAEELETSLSSAHQSNPSGLIRLSAPDGFGGTTLIRTINKFRSSYPEVRFDLQLTNEPVDLIEERIDLAFRLTYDLQDSTLIARKLGQAKLCLYASDEYLARKGQPAELADLEHHDCLHVGTTRYGDYWTIIQNGKIVKFRKPWSLVIPNTLSLIQATAEGAGIAAIPDLFVRDHPCADQLTRLDGVVAFPDLEFFVLYPSRKHLAHRVTAFLDFLNQTQPFVTV